MSKSRAVSVSRLTHLSRVTWVPLFMARSFAVCFVQITIDVVCEVVLDMMMVV